MILVYNNFSRLILLPLCRYLKFCNNDSMLVFEVRMKKKIFLVYLLSCYFSNNKKSENFNTFKSLLIFIGFIIIKKNLIRIKIIMMETKIVSNSPNYDFSQVCSQDLQDDTCFQLQNHRKINNGQLWESKENKYQPQSQYCTSQIKQSSSQLQAFLRCSIQQWIQIKNNIELIQSYLPHKASRQKKKSFVYDIFKDTTYALHKLKPPSQLFVESKSLLLKFSCCQKKYLILNLDKLLIYSQKVTEPKQSSSGSLYKFQYRPYLFTFLQKMHELYDIYIFADTERKFNEAIVKKINQHKQYIKDILHKEHCFKTKQGKNLKDLRIIKNRELKDIVMIDHKVESFGLQINNGIPFLEFDGASDDRQLLQIIPFLEQISKVPDVRQSISKKYNLTKLGKFEWKKVQKYLQFEFH